MHATVLSLLLGLIGATAAHGPFTDDFIDFLKSNSKTNEALLTAAREFGDSGTFGGKTDDDEKVDKQPVIFVHGNSDSSLFHSSPYATGWTKHVEHFKEHGYKSSELYGMTYGDRNIANSVNNRITCRNILSLRRLIEAVLDYTKAEKVDIIAHSMGVTLARKAIQGGRAVLSEEICNIGENIADKIDALVGLAGANYGMCMCLIPGIDDKASCSNVDGFHPGTCGFTNQTAAGGLSAACGVAVSPCEKQGYSHVLKQVNSDSDRDATFVASIWSKDDAVLGIGNKVWGRKTSIIPGSDFEFEFESKTHWQVKDDTIAYQYSLVTKHRRGAEKRSTGGRHHRHQ